MMTRIKALCLVLGILLSAGCDLLWSDQPLPAVSPGIPTAAQPTVPPPLQPIQPHNVSAIQQFDDLEINYPFRLVWAQGGQSLGVIGAKGINLYETINYSRTAFLNVIPPAFALDLSPDGITAALTTDQKSLELVDITSGETLHKFNPRFHFQTAFFSPDGLELGLTSAEEIAVGLFDVSSTTSLRSLRGFQTTEAVYSARFSTDGTRLLFTAGNKAQVMQVENSQLSPTIFHQGTITAGALSPDNTLLATASTLTLEDGSTAAFIRLWDAATGDEIFGLQTAAGVTSLTFSPDGLLLAGGVGTEIVLWNVITQGEVAHLSGHAGSITALAFSPDGLTLASASVDGTVRLWGVR
jgi:hypothetical protein